MKNIILLFPFLVPAFLFAQYPTGSNKSRLGWQTTGDGLIWRGVAGDTVNKPNSRNYPYFQLDTVNSVLYRYIQTRGKWQEVGGGVDIDSLIYATRFWVNSNFFPLQGGLLTGTGGNGFVGFPLQSSPPSTPATGFSLYAGSTGNNISWMQPDGFFRRLVSPVTGTPRQYQFMARSYTLADSADVANNVTSIAANYLATSNGTNLVARNLFDNNTYVGILNSKPFSLGQWTTAGRPSGTTGYTGYNTTTAFTEGYFTSQWENYITSTGAANGQLSIFSSAGKTYGTNNLFWDNSNTRLGIGTATPSQDVHLRKGVAGAVQFSVENTAAGTTAFAGYRLTNNTGAVGAIFKLSSTYTTYKNQAANDFGIINQTNGNMSFLNDNGTGNISFATGSLSVTERQLTIEADGDVFIPQKMGLGITPTSKLDLRQDQNAPTRMVVSNQSTGNVAWAGVSMGNSTGGYSFYKLSSGYTTYKTQMANDAGFINTVSGNISLLNDWASGKIIFAAGASSTANLTIEANGQVGIGNITATESLDVNGDARIRDSLRVATTPAHTSITGLLTRDANGWHGLATVGTGLSYAAGVLSATGTADGNGIISALPLGNVKITSTNSLTFNTGVTRWTGSTNQTGTYISRGFVGVYKTSAGDSGGTIAFGDTIARDNAFYLNQDDRSTIQNLGTGRQFTIVAENTSLPGTYRWAFGARVDTSTSSLSTLRVMLGDRYASALAPVTVSVNAGVQPSESVANAAVGITVLGGSGKKAFTVNDGITMRMNGKVYFAIDSTLAFDPSTDLLRLSQYGTLAKTAAATGKTGTNINATFATDGTILEIERKRDTTITFTADTDYNFAAAITSANILNRYNRIIIYSKLSSGATSDNQIFLHTPSADFLQCEIIIYSNDASADSDATSIDFTVNGAVDGAGGTVSSYGMSPGQRVNIRVVDDGGYKWFFN